MSEFRIDTATVCFIVTKARAFDAKVAPGGMEAGSNAVDDEAMGALENRPRDPVEQELRQAIEALNGAELADLTALMRLGRDDGSIDDWPDLLVEILEEPPERPVDDLVGTPLLGDYLEEGLARFGVNCMETGEGVPPQVSRFKAE
jgi:hypothetical protein